MIFKKKILRHLLISTVIIGALIPLNSNCQVTLNYNWSYGGSHNDGNYESRTLEKSPGLFITTTSKISTDGDVLDFQGGMDVWLFSHDQNRNILWQKSIGGTGAENPTEILSSRFNQIILVGTTNSSNGHFNSQDSLGDAFVVKTDSVGNILWIKNFGGSNLDLFSDVVEDDFGNLYLAGASKSNNGDVPINRGGFDLWLLKLDSSGNILWNKTIGGTGSERHPTLYIDSDGNIILGARSDSYDSTFVLTSGNDDAIIVKLNDSGIIQWVNRYGGSSYDGFNSISTSFNGGYILTGYTSSSDGDVGIGKGGGDLWILETDTSGNIVWSNRFGGTRDDAGREILRNNNKYSVVGITESNDIDVNNYHYNGTSYESDIWYLEIDSNGQMIWNRCFGSTWDDFPGSVNILGNETVLITGTVSEADGDVSFLNGNNGFRDLWVVNFSSPTSLVSNLLDMQLSVIAPNPFKDKFNLIIPSAYSENMKNIVIRNVLGQVVYKVSTFEPEIEFDLSHLPEGTYFMEQIIPGLSPGVFNHVLIKN